MSLAGRRYAVLVAEGVEDLEFWVTVMRIQEEGGTVVAVGSDTDPHRGKNGLTVQAEASQSYVQRSFIAPNTVGTPPGCPCGGTTVGTLSGSSGGTWSGAGGEGGGTVLYVAGGGCAMEGKVAGPVTFAAAAALAGLALLRRRNRRPSSAR